MNCLLQYIRGCHCGADEVSRSNLAGVNPPYLTLPSGRGEIGWGYGRGFTLIEVIIFLVMAGIILPLIFIPFMAGIKNYITPEIVSTATFLGEELVEEIKSKRFDETLSPPYTDPANLGPEGGEARSTYDDVDDYDGLTETPSGFTSYGRDVTVFYVDPNGNLDTDAGSIQVLKKVRVRVTNAEIPDVALVTLVSQ